MERLEESLDIPAPIALPPAILNWVEAHRYAFSSIASYVTILHGGLERNLTTPRALAFLLSLPQEAPCGNPSKKFRLLGVRVATKEELGSFVGNWDAWQERRREYQDKLMDRPRRVLAGAMLGFFILKDSPNILSSNFFPVCRLPRRDSNDVDPVARPVLEDLFLTCMASINAGLVLRLNNEGDKLYPDIGVFKRRKKKWVWRKQPEQTWTTLATYMDAVGYGLCTSTGPDPRLVFAKYWAEL
ncbi:hypothetical protein OH77DRAFT_1092711 [Trametes cingulata]|nr:hypothetical protein OH77DRAFT_1092711 [Trametes cingulata]